MLTPSKCLVNGLLGQAKPSQLFGHYLRQEDVCQKQILQIVHLGQELDGVVNAVFLN